MSIELSELERFRDLAAQAAMEAGGALLEEGFAVLSEKEHDVKSAGDLRAHDLICRRLEKTCLPLVSEEDGASWDLLGSDGLKWIIDPLDGTVNYTKGSPLCCVSIGLWEGWEPRLGVVYDFKSKELLLGGPQLGAFCNGVPIRVSEAKTLGDAILGTGFPSGRSHDDGQLVEFARLVGRYRKVRLLGSAALSLTWVARGWLDAYQEDGIYFWDVAAGLPIVLGAGGVAKWSSFERRLETLSAKAGCASTVIAGD